MKALTTFFLVCLFLTTPALAQNDVEDVKAAVLDFYTRLNAGDATYASVWHPGATTYPRAGGLLGSEVGQRTQSAVQAAFDAGLEYNVTVRNLEAQIYGGDSAIATYYTGGIVTNPAGGSIEGGSFRATMVWTKESGEWTIVHLHISPL